MIGTGFASHIDHNIVRAMTAAGIPGQQTA